MNDASRPLLSLFALAALSGCLDDTTAATRRAQQSNDAAAKYAAAALASAALSMASGQAAPNVTQQGQQTASMLCPLFNDTARGYFVTWPTARTGIDPGRFRAEVAARVGSEFLTEPTAQGEVIAGGVDLAKLPGCALPVLEPGTPIVAVPVSIPAATFAAYTREETRAEDCPQGYQGAAISRRLLSYDANGKQSASAWELEDMGGCVPAPRISVSITRPALAPWASPSTGALQTLLAALSPRDCTAATVAKPATERDEAPLSYAFSTCAAVTLAGYSTPAPPSEPDPAPVPVPEVCTWGTVDGHTGAFTQMFGQRFRLNGFWAEPLIHKTAIVTFIRNPDGSLRPCGCSYSQLTNLNAARQGVCTLAVH